MPANLTYQDGIWTAPVAVTLPEFSAPFPLVNVDYVLTQDFQQALDDYTPLALNTLHDDYPDFILVAEGNKRDLGGGMVQWTRTYAKIPADWEDRVSIAFTFPGIYANFGGTGVRDPFSKTVVGRVVNEYSLGPVDPLPMFQPYFDGPVQHGFTNILYLPLSDAGPTVPSIDDYLAMVDAGDEIVAQDSDVRPWMGNIHVRQTIYVKAQ